MTWIRANKLLAAFLGFVIVAAAGLAFLLFQAVGHFQEVDGNYKSQIEKLNGLQASVPFPNEENLKKFKEEESSLHDAIKGLEDDVFVEQFPLEPLTPEGFQDNLRTAVNNVAAKASERKPAKVVPDKFAFGFERYLSETPKRDAAPQLGRQLKAIEFLVNELIDSKVEAITSVVRPQLPEEIGASATQPAPKVAQSQLVAKQIFDITFVSDQGRFRKILNDLVDTKKQFYIIRLIHVKNLVQTAPSKASTNALSAPLGAPQGAKSTPGSLHYIVGNEKLEITLKLEIVDFNPPRK